ncbi:MAG: hypothetical protein AB1352_01095 [Patescibacteria group bacterium]
MYNAPMTSLQHSLINTLSWFDLFDYPLTAWEAYRWLCVDREQAGGSAQSYEEVLEGLRALVADKAIASQWSFFFLPSREDTVETRRARYLIADNKFKRAQAVTRLFRFLPWMRMVAVCNTLGYSNAARGSDIDFLIITAPGRLWTVRALCLTLLALLGLRPSLKRFGAKKEERRDKIDLTFFLSEDALDISPLALPGSDPSYPTDPYLMYWLLQMVPLWDRGGVYERLWSENATLRAPVPYAIPYRTSSLRRVSGRGRAVQAFFEWLGGRQWIERLSRRVQYAILPRRLREEAKRRQGVVLDEHILKFHDHDRREEYRERWITSIAQKSNLKT